jgi:hypothetical protein
MPGMEPKHSYSTPAEVNIINRPISHYMEVESYAPGSQCVAGKLYLTSGLIDILSGSFSKDKLATYLTKAGFKSTFSHTSKVALRQEIPYSDG